MDSVKILGVPFSRLTLSDTVKLLQGKLEGERAEGAQRGLFHLITANPEIVMAANQQPRLREIVDAADLITPDGIGVVLAAKWQGTHIPERVTGYDLLIGLFEGAAVRGFSLYVVGADEETNAKAVDIIKDKYAGVNVVGRHNGYFKGNQETALVADIGRKQPDLLIVALGAPNAEKFIYKHKNSLNAKVAFGVGGSLDVIAGKVKRAPVIWQKLNVEWLYRLLKQPSRWRRQLVLPKFALTILTTKKR
ncbi:WecB/TagA/CpsF family glycosyltransferase [Paenibacillus sacheonensis]|uniref:N-acetylglucosaminyldiphosphoundecaprenol N-acetyl-beta-D-mannosaminyltransferase n=1 Tax=Paenibacillus sacheonensis TaxID=742054 RepID=A0A7X4YW44_9BACL|nr:WecB/TagA/CpsF family glycosyltransferase [Paenibacillus sacheonensis]MBM7566625.1 N-acetylglucosaminyldiphosphoundecaprenol N-acetyl-beta-D-mannosaminyltransferase [Paenibacillus sacheonensis]NBC73543.1 WecB/TagA/CpsF family glycosyltransferase [Paenibacillus sacheonensis]